MKLQTRIHTIAVMSLLLCLPACGGSGIEPPPPPPPDPSALPAGDLIVFGPMPATSGAFVIAGVSFDTVAAQVTVDDQPAVLSALRPGHLIAMIGETDTNGRTTAEKLFFNANLIGDVDSVNVAANTLIVMGQPIEVVEESILTTPMQNFTTGEVVQVSGYTNSDGNTIASRIDYSVSNRELRLIGPVASLDTTNFRFRINGLDVDYSQAQMIDTPNGEVQQGMEVLISGGRSPNGTFQAQAVTHYDRDVSEFAGAHLRAQGRITAARSGEDFSINGFPVVMGGQRDYRQGSADDIVVGAAVRVEGNILNDATVQVHRVWFLHE